MLIDQDTKVDGVWVPFFGRPAFTPVGAAKIALRQKAQRSSPPSSSAVPTAATSPASTRPGPARRPARGHGADDREDRGAGPPAARAVGLEAPAVAAAAAGGGMNPDHASSVPSWRGPGQSRQHNRIVLERRHHPGLSSSEARDTRFLPVKCESQDHPGITTPTSSLPAVGRSSGMPSLIPCSIRALSSRCSRKPRRTTTEGPSLAEYRTFPTLSEYLVVARIGTHGASGPGNLRWVLTETDDPAENAGVALHWLHAWRFPTSAAGSSPKDHNDTFRVLEVLRDPLAWSFLPAGPSLEPPTLPWARIDLSREPFVVEAGEPVTPRSPSWARRRCGTCGWSRPASSSSFPTRTAGQVQALEMKAGSRARWAVRIGQDAYFSFTPLGSEGTCSCTYRVGVRRGPGQVRELYRIESAPVGPIAPSAVEVDLSDHCRHEVELLLQVDRTSGLRRRSGGARPSTSVSALPAQKPGSDRPNILLVGLDTLRADALGRLGAEPSLTPALDRLAGAERRLARCLYTCSTSPTRASSRCMTGLYGKNHGVYDLQTPLPPSHATLAEHLASARVRHLGGHLGQPPRAITTRGSARASASRPRHRALRGRARGRHRPSTGSRSAAEQTPVLRLAPPLRPAHAAHAAAALRPRLPPARAAGPRSGPRLGPVPPARAAGVRRARPRRPAATSTTARSPTSTARSAACSGSWRAAVLLENTLLALVADHGESLGEHGVLLRHVGPARHHHPRAADDPLAGSRSGRGGGSRGWCRRSTSSPRSCGPRACAVPPQDGQDLRS